MQCSKSRTWNSTLHTALLYYEARKKHFQYYFVLQSLHKVLPSTKVLIRTTKLVQSTPRYHFVLQSLHKDAQSTSQYYCVLQSFQTLYYKACAKYFPVLLCNTMLAQSTFQYYFVLHSLHEVLPSTTLYYKAGTKYFPVLLTGCAKYFPTHIKLLLRSFYTGKLLHIEKLLHTENFAHGKLWHTERFAHSKLLHTEANATFMQPIQCVLQCHVTNQKTW